MEEKKLHTCYELFGIECGEGWKPLYQPVIDYITEYNKTHEDNPIKITQIKEKYASLRIYVNYYTEELEKLIDEAEDKSFNTCEKCGKHIDEAIVEHNWYYALCDDCYNEMKRKRDEEFLKFK